MDYQCTPNPYGFTLVIPHTPIPWKRPGQSGRHRYDTQKALKEQLIVFFKQAMNKRKPFTGPIRLILVFYFVLPKSKKPDTKHITKPDTDNLIKFYQDCMTNAGVWKDDAQVYKLIVEKKYTYTHNQEDENVYFDVVHEGDHDGTHARSKPNTTTRKTQKTNRRKI